MIVLYSTGCPLCRTLEGRLKQAGISYTVIDDETEIMAAGFQSVPVLMVNGKSLYFPEAMAYADRIRKENSVNEDQHQTG